MLKTFLFILIFNFTVIINCFAKCDNDRFSQSESTVKNKDSATLSLVVQDCNLLLTYQKGSVNKTLLKIGAMLDDFAFSYASLSDLDKDGLFEVNIESGCGTGGCLVQTYTINPKNQKLTLVMETGDRSAEIIDGYYISNSGNSNWGQSHTGYKITNFQKIKKPITASFVLDDFYDEKNEMQYCVYVEKNVDLSKEFLTKVAKKVCLDYKNSIVKLNCSKRIKYRYGCKNN